MENKFKIGDKVVCGDRNYHHTFGKIGVVESVPNINTSLYQVSLEGESLPYFEWELAEAPCAPSTLGVDVQKSDNNKSSVIVHLINEENHVFEDAKWHVRGNGDVLVYRGDEVLAHFFAGKTYGVSTLYAE